MRLTLGIKETNIQVSKNEDDINSYILSMQWIKYITYWAVTTYIIH